jgi:TusA-related sulfurtransferase
MEKNINIVDTSGYSCPIPLIMLSRKLKRSEVGDTLKVISDDPVFNKEIKIWSYETGNPLLNIISEGEDHIAWVRKGSGFKGETILETVKFISLGVKLHFIKTFLQLIPLKKIRYLVTFVSVAAGSRAHRWLEQKGIKNYTLLPIPDGITKHCGLVLGYENKNAAIEIFRLLKENDFEAEDIYFEDKNKSYQILNFNW